jgi:hypothetical protein
LSEEFRFDRGQIGPNWEETPEGFLRVKATFARTGCQTYQRADGRKVVEYRPEEEVAARDSILSLGGLPVTLEHPPELLTPKNVRQHQRGSTGTTVNYDNGFVTGVVTITDADAIEAVKRGDAREVSIGYRVQLDPTPGVDPFGNRYDAVQRRISGNHLALTREGRAGPQVRLHMDSAFSLDFNPPPSSQEASMSDGAAVRALENVGTTLAEQLGAAARADGGMKHKPPMDSDYMDPEDDGDPEDEEEPEELMEPPAPMKRGRRPARSDSAVISLVEHNRIVDALKARLDARKEAHEADLGRLDALSLRLDELESDLDTRHDSATFDSLLEERLELLDRCHELAGERLDFAGLSPRELQIAALEKAGHDISRFDGQSDDYVAATFDVVLEMRGGAAGAASRVDHVASLERALGSATTDAGGQPDYRAEMEATTASAHKSNSAAA